MSTEEADKLASELADSSAEPDQTSEQPQQHDAAVATSAMTSPAPPAARVPPRQGAFARAWLWFWLRDVQPTSRPPAYEELVGRARVAADVARRTEDSPEPFADDVSPVICELYRQSIHWSLLALSGSTERASFETDIVHKALPELELRARVEAALDGGFEGLARLTPSDRVTLLVGLRRLASVLVAELEFDRRAVEAIWVQRAFRVGLLVALLATITGVTLGVLDRAERLRDLAVAAPWRASSAYGGASSCHSPEQGCSESPEYFFHTQEEQSPWIEFDLRSPQRISGVRVENRADCCVDRVAPMVVEVSSDQHHWQKVLRRDTPFAVWSASFAPATARWVRFRLDKKDSLHLRSVRILRAGG